MGPRTNSPKFRATYACFNVTGRTKTKGSEVKRARSGKQGFCQPLIGAFLLVSNECQMTIE